MYIYEPIVSVQDRTELEMIVRYSKGGPNIFTGKPEPRGLFLHLQPVKRRPVGNGMMVKCMSVTTGDQAERGFKVFLEPLHRASMRRLTYWEEKIKALKAEIATRYDKREFSQIIARVLESELLTV